MIMRSLFSLSIREHKTQSDASNFTFRILYEKGLRKKYVNMVQHAIKVLLNRFVRDKARLFTIETKVIPCGICGIELLKTILKTLLFSHERKDFLVLLLNRKRMDMPGSGSLFGFPIVGSKMVLIATKGPSYEDLHKVVYHEIAESLWIRHCKNATCYMFAPDYTNLKRYENKRSFCSRCNRILMGRIKGLLS